MVNTDTRTLTFEELLKYNGANGTPVYVRVCAYVWGRV